MQVRVQLQKIERNLTISLAAWLFIMFPDDINWENSSEFEMVLNALKSIEIKNFNELNSYLATTSSKEYSRKDHRIQYQIVHAQEQADNFVIKLYTDYDLLKEKIKLEENIILVESFSDAELLLLTKNVKNFIEIPINQIICQFPYESCIVRKVLVFFFLLFNC
jgi:hypothetical protein